MIVMSPRTLFISARWKSLELISIGKKQKLNPSQIQKAGAHLGWMPARSFLSTSSLLQPTTASGRVSPLPVVQGKSSCEEGSKVQDTMYIFNLIPQFTSATTVPSYLHCVLPISRQLGKGFPAKSVWDQSKWTKSTDQGLNLGPSNTRLV